EADIDVAWVEKDDRRRSVVVAPLPVAGTLANHLYAERTVVATSATLALGGRFDTVAKALGLTEGDGTWQSLDVGSPFEYARQCRWPRTGRRPSTRPGVRGSRR